VVVAVDLDGLEEVRDGVDGDVRSGEPGVVYDEQVLAGQFSVMRGGASGLKERSKRSEGSE